MIAMPHMIYEQHSQLKLPKMKVSNSISCKCLQGCEELAVKAHRKPDPFCTHHLYACSSFFGAANDKMLYILK